MVALAAHAKNPAGHRDVESVVDEFTDQRENYCGRTFSRAKYAAARLRISFSISSRRLALRSSASSRFSSLVSRDELPPRSSASAWASQFRRHDSLIDNCLASAAISCSPRRASSMARRRNSGEELNPHVFEDDLAHQSYAGRCAKHPWGEAADAYQRHNSVCELLRWRDSSPDVAGACSVVPMKSSVQISRELRSQISTHPCWRRPRWMSARRS